MKHILLGSILLFLLSCNIKPPADIILCPVPELVNLTDKWTSQDQSHYVFNKNLCTMRFEKSHCLKRFTKTGTLQYQIICSGK